jgi:hypothetical protein
VPIAGGTRTGLERQHAAAAGCWLLAAGWLWRCWLPVLAKPWLALAGWLALAAAGRWAVGWAVTVRPCPVGHGWQGLAAVSGWSQVASERVTEYR